MPKKVKMISKHLKVPDPVIKEVSKDCARNGETFTAWVQHAIRLKLMLLNKEKHGKKRFEPAANYGAEEIRAIL